MPDWKKHCPIDEDQWPVQRKHSTRAWIYCMEHGRGLSDEKAQATRLEIMEKYGLSIVPGLLHRSG